jgi:2,4-dienoyl-CoA reductase-like NADH-dependent reductase (Old Yellow Enzyme family)
MNRFPHVFKTVKIKNVEISNRIVLPPLVTGYSNLDGSIGERQKMFYKAIAKDGVGLVIIGAAAVTQDGILTVGCSRIDKDDYIEGMTELFSTIKAEGSVPGIQLAHAGRQTNTRRTGGVSTVAPSAIACPVNNVMPRELAVNEIKNMENAFVQAALRSLKAGAEFIEFHAAHGYLINQFLSPFSNHRADEYGGSLENRARFALNIIKSARDQVGESPVLGFRISADEFVDGGLTLEESKKVCQWMVANGADFIDVSAGIASVDWEIRSEKIQEGTYLEIASAIKKAVDVPVICVGGICSLESAEKILREDLADLVAMGRAFIADPELISKTLNDKEGSIVDCINCRYCFQTIMDDDGNGMECTQNPDLPQA